MLGQSKNLVRTQPNIQSTLQKLTVSKSRYESKTKFS